MKGALQSLIAAAIKGTYIGLFRSAAIALLTVPCDVRIAKQPLRHRRSKRTLSQGQRMPAHSDINIYLLIDVMISTYTD